MFPLAHKHTQITLLHKFCVGDVSMVKEGSPTGAFEASWAILKRGENGFLHICVLVSDAVHSYI